MNRYLFECFLNYNDIDETKKHNLPVLFENKENCCGCTACYSICPKNAIVMKYDEEGFLYPIIDAVKCVCCKMCLSVCAFKLNQTEKGYLKNYDGDLL